jgi:hypothetical protein
MKPDPTIPISYDYLVELSDDCKASEQLPPEIILLPPVPRTPDGSAAPARVPEQGPQPESPGPTGQS